MSAPHTALREQQRAILRAWRESADTGGKQLHVAKALNVTPQAVSHWELGRARPDWQQLHELDEWLGAQRGLVDLWAAAARPLLLQARVEWRHNFQFDGHPCWAWLQLREPAPGRAHVRWGSPFRGDVDLPEGGRGLILTFPTSLPNPPLEVTLPAPGWVAFGHGDLPAAVAWAAGADIADARDRHADAAPEETAISGSLALALITGAAPGTAQVVRDLRLRGSLIRPHLGGLRPQDDHALDALDVEPSVSAVSVATPVETSLHGVSVSSLRHVRETLELSRAAVADLLTRMDPDEPVTARQVGTVKDEPRTRAVAIIARLDRLYGLDGRTGPVLLHTQGSGQDGRITLRFPSYWVGPVWLQPLAPSPSAVGPVVVTWGPWRRRVRVAAGEVLTTNKATASVHPVPWGMQPPLREELAVVVQLPPGWRLAWGTGVVPTARDINHRWYPVAWASAAALLKEGVAAVMTAMGENRAARERKRRRYEDRRTDAPVDRDDLLPG